MSLRSRLALVLVAISSCAFAVPADGLAALKRESFDHDPDWEGFNNHVTPKRVPVVVQDFGYCSSHFAGNEKGEIGGKVWRSSTRASYSANIPSKTLLDKLTASGTFAIT